MIRLLRFGTILLLLDCSTSSFFSDHYYKDYDGDLFGDDPFGADQPCDAETEYRKRSTAEESCKFPVLHTQDCPPYDALEEWLDPCYCSEGVIFDDFNTNLCCQFRNQAVDWNNVELTQQTVHLINSSDLQMYVDPEKVNVLYVFDSANVAITVGQNDLLDSGSIFGAINSAGRDVPLFQTIRLTNSSFYSIPPSPDVQSICLIESNLEYLEHITITGDQNYEEMIPGTPAIKNCFKIDNSNLDRIEDLNLKCSGLISQSNVTEIQHLQFEKLTVVDSWFGTITPEGLTITKYALELSNVKIGYLHRGGITAKPNMTLSLSNVIVEHCDEPCILVQNITMEKFFVNGREIQNTSDSVFSDPYRREYRRPTRFELDELVCTKVAETGMSCNRVLPDPPVVELYLANYNLTPYDVKIANHTHLVILEGCEYSIEISNVTGAFYPFEHFVCDHRVPVNITNSSLSAFVSISIDDFMASNSKIDFLNLFKPMRNFTALDLKTADLKNLEFFRETTTPLSYFGGSIDIVRNILLHSPAVFSNTIIKKIEKFTLDYLDAPREQLTVLLNCTIGKVDKHGIYVANGTLLLSNVTFLEVEPEIIKLGEGGKVILEHMDYNKLCSDCIRRGPIFSVLFTHQVVFTGSHSPSPLSMCFSYRPTATGESAGILQPLHSETVNLDRNIHCSFVDQRHEYVCAVSPIKQTIVLGNSSALNSMHAIRIVAAKNLTIAEHCVTKVTLERCNVTRTETYPWTCPLRLTTYSSVLDQIANNMKSIDLIRSTVRVIDALQPDTVTIKGSKIQQLLLRKASVVEIVNSTLTDLKGISVQKEMTVLNSTLGKLQNIVVNEGSSLTVSNTIISNLEQRAISVYGDLIMNNVTVEEPIVGAIWVAKTGTVRCANFNVPQTFEKFKIFEWEDPTKRFGDICSA